MKNITLKTNDTNNIVHLRCFHTYDTRTTTTTKITQNIVTSSPGFSYINFSNKWYTGQGAVYFLQQEAFLKYLIFFSLPADRI
jgi:hypothetical protein